MKKINGTKVCYGLSVLLVVGFIISTIIGYNRYYNTNTLNSAPFYLCVVINIVYFIVPAIIALIVGIVIKKKTKTD